MKVLCIDIGGTNIKYSLFSEGTHGVIGKKPTPAGLNTSDMKLVIFEIIDEYLNNGDIIDFISFSTCGQMRDNVVLYTSSKPGYIGCDWSLIIKEKYNLPCVANNDLHAAVMGEYHYGLKHLNAHKPNNFICLAIGTGINIGVVIGGDIFTGDGNLACYLDNVTDLDGNNQFKCASTASLLRLYNEEGGDKVSGEQFISLLKSEDSLALKCYSIWVGRVARLIKAVIYMYNINTISVCGGIVNADYPILEDVLAKIKECVPEPYYKDLVIHKSVLSSSQLYGALAYADLEEKKKLSERKPNILGRKVVEFSDNYIEASGDFIDFQDYLMNYLTRYYNCDEVFLSIVGDFFKNEFNEINGSLSDEEILVIVKTLDERLIKFDKKASEEETINLVAMMLLSGIKESKK